MTDPITDMLNRIRNASVIKKSEVSIPFSSIKNSIALIMERESYVGEVKKIAKGGRKFLKIILKYNDGLPAIEGMKRVSKPGQRIYVKAGEIKKVRQGFGVSIISTPKGLMTGKEAKRAKLGGEVLLEIW